LWFSLRLNLHSPRTLCFAFVALMFIDSAVTPRNSTHRLPQSLAG
jgi:hypothetical protein